MNTGTTSFLGTGWSFPPAFDRILGGAQMSSGIQDIEESIRIILGTTPGERIMHPDFGAGVARLVFEGLSTTFFTRLHHEVDLALLNFEPRVIFHDLEMVEHEPLEGRLHIRINYTVITTNTRHNLVYPFYLLEGTNAAF